MVSGPFIVFICTVIGVIVASIYTWLTRLHGADFIRDKISISPDTTVAQDWHYFSTNLPEKPKVYVDDVPFYFWRWKYLKQSTLPGKTRYGIEYKPLNQDIAKPYYIEVNDDKLVQVGKENLGSQGVGVWRVLSETARSPVMRELESTRKQLDIKTVQARTAQYQINKITLDDAVRKANVKMQEGKIHTSRTMRNIGTRYSEDGGGQSGTNNQKDNDDNA